MASETQTAEVKAQTATSNGSNGADKRSYAVKPKLSLDEREMRALRVLLNGGEIAEGWKRRVLAKLNAVIEPDIDFTIDPS